MRYWLDRNDPLLDEAKTQCNTLENMLDQKPSVGLAGVGTCEAWSSLFREVLRAQGINDPVVVEIRSLANRFLTTRGRGFIVKNLRFGGHVRTGPLGINLTRTQGDDREWIPLDRGSPREVCVGPGSDLTLQTTTTGGDDSIGDFEQKGKILRVVFTGDNGICETAADQRDIQIIPIGSGAPNTICITPGPNGTLNSPPVAPNVSRDGVYVEDPRNPPEFTHRLATDAMPQSGIPGQGTPSPPQVFLNHFIVRVGNRASAKLYDPSYGAGPFPATAAGEVAYEDQAIDAFYRVPNTGIPEKAWEFTVRQQRVGGGANKELVFIYP